MRRKAVVFWSMLAAWMFCLSALAANAGKFLREGYEVEDGRLQIMGSELPSGGKLTVAVGTQRDVSAVLLTAEEAGLHTTVYCLVDVSGSMKEEQMEQMRGVLQAISDEMKEGDTLVLASMGEEVSVSEPLDTREAREEAISALQAGSAYTNLYKGVIDSINQLSTNVTYHRNRCLVIFSDGEDDHRTGATREEAEKAVQASSIPVYAVAALRTGADEAAQEYGKQLRGFASVSLGGKGYTPALDGMESTEAGKDIWRSMQGNTVIRLELDGLQYDGEKDSLILKAVYETEDARYEDTMTLYTVDLPEPGSPGQAPAGEEVLLPEVSAEEEMPADEASSGTAEAGGKRAFLFWAAGALAVSVTAAIAILLCFRGKRGREEIVEKEGDAGERFHTIPAAQSISGVFPQSPEKEKQPEIPAPVKKEKPFRKTECKIILTAIGHEKRRITFRLEKNCSRTLGRGKHADIVLDGSDNRLSDIHCELKWDGEQLHIRDRESTNGSFVDGVPIQPKFWMPLEDSAMLRIGAYEYRVRLEAVTGKD